MTEKDIAELTWLGRCEAVVYGALHILQHHEDAEAGRRIAELISGVLVRSVVRPPLAAARKPDEPKSPHNCPDCDVIPGERHRPDCPRLKGWTA